MAGGLKYQSATSLDQMRHLGDFVEWGWVEVKIDPDFVCVTKAGRQKQRRKKGRRERKKDRKEERKEGRNIKKERIEGREQGWQGDSGDKSEYRKKERM